MYFNDRVTLGATLADRLRDFRGKDTIIVCLEESSLLTCLSMAMHLRAWVYPLVFERLYDHGAGNRLIGAIDQDGDFIMHPSLRTESSAARTAADELADTQKKTMLAVTRKRQDAYGMSINKEQLKGRTVILAGDVVPDVLPLAVAEQLLPRTAIKQLAVAIGNASPEVANLAGVSSGTVVLLDIISGIMTSNESYFAHPDGYSEEQKRTLTKHIVTYWQ